MFILCYHQLKWNCVVTVRWWWSSRASAACSRRRRCWSSRAARSARRTSSTTWPACCPTHCSRSSTRGTSASTRAAAVRVNMAAPHHHSLHFPFLIDSPVLCFPVSTRYNRVQFTFRYIENPTSKLNSVPWSLKSIDFEIFEDNLVCLFFESGRQYLIIRLYTNLVQESLI